MPNKKGISDMICYKRSIRFNLMKVKLRPKVMHMYPEYLGKSEEVSIKYNLAISISLNIQFTYGIKLMIDGINW